ncbi:phytanoyl-CoA dioxygenase family protein [Microbulbifer spongiae]|uniref:Phytanoyl-CoA dioxygenase family protein n=1 Tax=Microbulbifer spongiae TaxID=2944933 RepID=A0ABY9E6X8_9GAMM|nr:phytanoyl-CoA dioxygenase family protein [Microbulbifer sp. MI-G]WKD48789.1 phytanoyl-CoA dioxygenase family protein [Microbulbifer sp. MI-G]
MRIRDFIDLVWKLPKWVFEIFSWGKSFRNNPLIGSYWLNRCGLHVIRVVVAHLLFRLRLLLLSPLVSEKDRKDFLEKGFILKKNFLPEAQFTNLSVELNSYKGMIREVVEGTTLTQRVFMDHASRRQAPEFCQLADNPYLDRLMRYSSSKNRPPFFFIENLCNHANVTPRPDPQRDMHADTFHPCVKAWLYIDGTDDQNGPYIYVPGSHRLSWGRLKWEYSQSLKACQKGALRDKGRYWDGSFRVSDFALAKMGLSVEKLCVPPNTLVIANVFGFHRRGEASAKSNRMTIWMQARDNPFNPLFTPCPKYTGRLFEWGWGKVLQRLDKRKIASGELNTFFGRFTRIQDSV